MSESHDSRAPQPRVRSGSHRAQRSVLAALLPSVLAVAAVAALITSLAVWQSEKNTATSAAAAAGSESADPGRPADKSDSSQTTPAATTAAASTAPAPSPTPEPSSASPSATAGADKPEPVREMTVVVLNQTTRRGLAAQIAAELQAKGWAVPGVGNFTGVVPATTVYYPPGADEQALVLARDLPTEPRVRPRFGNLSTSSLTIVVTDSYPR